MELVKQILSKVLSAGANRMGGGRVPSLDMADSVKMPQQVNTLQQPQFTLSFNTFA